MEVIIEHVNESASNPDRDSSVINLEDEEDTAAQNSLLTLKSEGSLLTGDNESDPIIEPEWIDKNKLARARLVFRRHLFGLFFNHLCGLVMLVFVETILKPLLYTRNSRSVAQLFRRYLSTLTHVKLWYDGDFWDKEDPARKSILQVRKMHKRVADQINVSKIKGAQELSISQYDMLVTQFAFIGLAVLHPKKFGLYWSEEDRDAVIHFWRNVGYLLGVDEKFNLCSRNNEELESLCRTILNYEMKISLSCDVQEAREMSRGILESIRPYIPLIRWDSFYKYLLYIIEADHCQVVLGPASTFIYHMIRITLRYVLRIYLLAAVLNYLLVRSLNSAQRKKNRIAKELSEKYSLTLGECVGNPIRSTLFEPLQSSASMTCVRSV